MQILNILSVAFMVLGIMAAFAMCRVSFLLIFKRDKEAKYREGSYQGHVKKTEQIREYVNKGTLPLSELVEWQKKTDEAYRLARDERDQYEFKHWHLIYIAALLGVVEILSKSISILQLWVKE